MVNQGVSKTGQAKAVPDREGLSGSTLKLIAIVTMFIDHIGAGILEQLPAYYDTNSPISDIDTILRLIGRIAFPIFCFLLVEGFLHTSNVKKYAMRLFLFALISEIPFDLAFKRQILEITYQNVFFTLFIGLLTLMAVKYFENNKVLRILSMFAGIAVAIILRTDYAGFGVVFILLLYVLHDKIKWRNIICSFAILWEITAPIAFIPITLYNGKRGINLKYFFYLFYPVHLLLIYAVSQLLI
ncbi:TraX family protein [Konateibacter massiliensis]|uniref:TraX family protein n=1 Tax=Konateibacter massiliensis TaxID=2002841 RepID=UPI000C15CFC0|nr:TraX family protein [Konateibacter massiliensis]